MVRLKLSQDEIDKLVVIDRIATEANVRSVGKYDVGVCTRTLTGEHVWQYKLWQSLIQRCFDKECQSRQPTYSGVTVCYEWLFFGNFLEWVNKEVDYKGKPMGFDLDKDLILKGNKTYSPDTCSFVPQAVNKLLTNRANGRGELPLGVSFCRESGRFKVSLSKCGVLKNLGRYGTAEDAFAAYKVAKEAQIKDVAMQYKDVLKPAVFKSLMSWEILNED